MFKKIGIIGAGQMGSGIAQVSSLASFEVNLIDVSDILLQNSINKLSFNNSHVLRAPLLKILGLINYIIEDSEEKSQMDLNALSMLKESCLELSEATEEVEKLLNSI